MTRSSQVGLGLFLIVIVTLAIAIFSRMQDQREPRLSRGLLFQSQINMTSLGFKATTQQSHELSIAPAAVTSGPPLFNGSVVLLVRAPCEKVSSSASPLAPYAFPMLSLSLGGLEIKHVLTDTKFGDLLLSFAGIDPSTIPNNTSPQLGLSYTQNGSLWRQGGTTIRAVISPVLSERFDDLFISVSLAEGLSETIRNARAELITLPSDGSCGQVVPSALLAELSAIPEADSRDPRRTIKIFRPSKDLPLPAPAVVVLEATFEYDPKKDKYHLNRDLG